MTAGIPIKYKAVAARALRYNGFLPILRPRFSKLNRNSYSYWACRGFRFTISDWKMLQQQMTQAGLHKELNDETTMTLVISASWPIRSKVTEQVSGRWKWSMYLFCSFALSSVARTQFPRVSKTVSGQVNTWKDGVQFYPHAKNVFGKQTLGTSNSL